MMMLGGSPTSVAVPPMLDAKTSATSNGTGDTPIRSASSTVTGAISSTVVTLSRSADAIAVITTSRIMIAIGRPRARLADRMARYSKEPGAPQHSYDDHHPEEQEDDVPVDSEFI